MVITNIVGCIKKGTLAERPAHAAYLNDYLYYVDSGPNLGDLYWDDGTAWVLLQGAAKAEILQNKTISTANNNTLTGFILDPFVTQKRQGYLIPSLTADGSLRYAMKGLPIAGGTYSLFYVDATEKYVSRFNSASVIQIGYQSNASIKLTTKRQLNPYLKVRARTTDANNTFMFFGFSTKGPTANGVSPIDNASQGVIVGCDTSNANYFTRASNGTTMVQSNTAIARDNIFRTFEIIMSSANVIIKINDVTIFTLTNNLPAAATDIHLLMELHNRSGNNNFDIAKAIFTSD